MKKLAKAAAIVIVVILAIAIIVPLALKGKIAGIVKQEANKMLTAQLDFEKLDISLLRHFPNASLELDGLTLVGGAEPFAGDTIVAADRISVVVNLMSLFGDSGFEVRRILLDKPCIHGWKSADGAVNWDVMKPSDAAEEETPEEPAEEEEASASSFRLALRDFSITDATLRYDDDSTRMYAAISPLNLNLKGDFSAAQSELKLKTVASNIFFQTEGLTLVNGAEMELNAQVAADLENQVFTLKENTLRVNAIQMMLDGWVALPDDAVDMDLKLASSEIEFREILSLVPAFYTKDFKNLKASGEMTLSAWAKGRLAGDSLPAFELVLGVKEGSFKYASLPQSVTGIRVAAKVANPGGVIDRTTVDVSDFGLTMAGNSLSASLRLATPVSDLQFDAAANGKVDLGAIKQVYPLEDTISLAGLITANVQVAGRMSDIEKQRYEQMKASGTLTVEGMSADVKGLSEVKIERATATVSPLALTLGECQVQVGASDLSANGQLSNYLGWFLRDDVLSGRLYVKSTLLDLNELMGALPASEEAEEAPEAEEGAAEGLSVFEVPKNLDLSLQTTLQKILFQKMTITDFTGALAVKNGTVDMSKLAMKAFGGSMAASGSYSTAQSVESPSLKLSAEITKASFSETFDQLELVQKIVPLFQKTGGDYSMSLDLSSRMTSDMGLDYSTLNASGELRSSNIQLQNLDIFEKLASAIKSDKLQTTLAKDLVVKFAIANGRLSTKPFDLKMGSTSLNLSGSTGLDQTIDYTAKVSLPASASSVLQDVDVKIGGTFSSPTFSVDVASAAKQAVTNVVNEQIQKLTGSADLSEEIAKQAEKLRAEAKAAGDKLIAAAQEQKEALVAKASNALTKIAAEKAGDALVKEAETQAANLQKKAEEQIAQLEAKAAGAVN